jgi:hypothetical protein
VVDNGVALGLYIVSDTAQRGDADFGQLDVLISDSYNLSNFGLFMTYYPVPDGPWFMTAGVGVGSALSINSDIATGFGALISGGYEWQLTRRWAIGTSGRLQIIDGTDEDQTTAEHHSVGLAALATVSFN